jgi:DNA repair exonuclease SbcCD ATPase subunit
MEFSHQEKDSYYKKLEAEINKRIHAKLNSRDVTAAFGRALEAHVKHLKIHRRLTTRWLNHFGFPNKDEICAISVRIVDYEGTLDHLDETIYRMNKKQQENLTQLKKVRKSWEDLRSVLEKEARETQTPGGKIKSLETELLELKRLF